jgi:hypothetical protein
MKILQMACQPLLEPSRFHPQGLTFLSDTHLNNLTLLEFPHEKAVRRSDRIDVRCWRFRR